MLDGKAYYACGTENIQAEEVVDDNGKKKTKAAKGQPAFVVIGDIDTLMRIGDQARVAPLTKVLHIHMTSCVES